MVLTLALRDSHHKTGGKAEAKKLLSGIHKTCRDSISARAFPSPSNKFAHFPAKLLLLTHAFEALQAIRVQFTTDELNEKSRAAILRIGAKQEGIVRNERIMPDGRKRNSVRFSIIDTEWNEVKAMLQQKMAR